MGLFRVLVSLGLIGLLATKISAKIGNVTTIFFRHYGNDSHEDINIQDIDSLKPYFQLAECSTVYFHGYTESVESESVKTIVGAYLNYTTANIFAIDYSDLVDVDYFYALGNVNNITEAIASAFNQMYNATSNPLNCLHFVGHSLGGQICGHVTKRLVFSVHRITGLDPAGPLFSSNHLNANDAKFVDIIHTDAGGYGQIFDSGTVNFRPNFGHRVQPGCPLINAPLSDGDYCSHHRSWMFWAESIKNETSFLGVKCRDNLLFALGLCNYLDIIPMGINTPRNATGIYYFHTNAQSPYAQGMQGIGKPPF